MQLNEKQTEQLRKIANNCGKDLVLFLEMMITSITDIRTEIEVSAELDKGVRLSTAKLLQDFIDRIKLLSVKPEDREMERFD